MTTFVLIHGAFGGGWNWDPVRGKIIQAGYEVVTPDLPGQGNDQTPLSEVTLDSYRDCVIDALDQQTESVVLAGHSLGGISISQAAEHRPDKIKALVYVAAFLLPDGSSPKHFWGSQAIQSPVMSHCDITEDGVITFRKEHIAEIIYNTSPAAAVEKAGRLQRPMARKPLGTPLRLSAGNYGRVPRVYFEAVEDKAIPIEYQRMMLQAMPCEKVVTFDTDHAPMASATEQFVDEVLALAYKICPTERSALPLRSFES